MKRRTLFCILTLLSCFVVGCSNDSSSDVVNTDSSSLEDSSEVMEETSKIEYTIDPEKPVIALTFDDGPNTTTTVEVLDMLEKHGVVASFFLVGNNINDNTVPVIQRAYAMGCEIDNHSKTHSYMNQMTAEDILAEVEFTSSKVEEAIGVPTRFFRPPYIAVNQLMFDTIDMPFISGIGANDWQDSVSAEARAEKIISQVKDGDIILLHDSQGNSKTVEALDTIIPTLLAQGYQFVTVTELYETKGIEIRSDADIVYSNATQTTMY